MKICDHPCLPLYTRWFCNDNLRPLQNAPFAQFQRQAQILILKILNVFLWLKLSPFLALNKIERFAKVSILIII